MSQTEIARRDAERSGVLGWVALAGIWGVVLVFTALQAGSLLARATFRDVEQRDISSAEFVRELARMDALDVYDDDVYWVNAMGNAMGSDPQLARKYADKLLATEEFDNCYRAAAYYFLPLRDWDGFFAATRSAVLQEASNVDAWNGVAELCMDTAARLEAEELHGFLPGVARYQEMLTAFNNSGRMEQIVLEEENQAFLDCAVSLHESGADGETAAAVLGDLLEN